MQISVRARFELLEGPLIQTDHASRVFVTIKVQRKLDVPVAETFAELVYFKAGRRAIYGRGAEKMNDFPRHVSGGSDNFVPAFLSVEGAKLNTHFARYDHEKQLRMAGAQGTRKCASRFDFTF